MVYLLSDGAAYVNAQVLSVSGGLTMQAESPQNRLVAVAPPASLAAPGSLCNTPSVPGCAAATDLPSTVNDQHYDLQAGATITATIIGATDLTGGETVAPPPWICRTFREKLLERVYPAFMAPMSSAAPTTRGS